MKTKIYMMLLMGVFSFYFSQSADVEHPPKAQKSSIVIKGEKYGTSNDKFPAAKKVVPIMQTSKKQQTSNDAGIAPLKNKIQNTNHQTNNPGKSVSCIITSTIDAASPTNTVRLLRDAVVSTCGTPKAFPGTTNDNVHYKVHSISNTTGATQCVTINATSTDNNYVHLTAYKNSFNPADLSQNYLGDSGSSFNTGTPQSMSVNIGAGETLVLVTNMNLTTGVMTGNYSLEVQGLPCAPSCTITDIIDSTTPTNTVRLYRDAVPSTCGVPKAFPGTATDNVHYKVHSISNTTGAAQCVTINATSTDSNYVHLTAYKNSFNPADLSQNYLGDLGSSFATGDPRTMSVNIGSGETLVLVTNLVATTGVMTSNYSLEIQGLPCVSSCTFTDKIISANPAMAKRLYRDAAASVCATPKSYPGDFIANVNYTTRKIVNNTGASQCLKIEASTDDPIPGGIHLTAYNGTFNPADLSQNYLADIGSSVLQGAPRSFEVTIPNGSTIILVMNTNTAGQLMTTGLLSVTVTGVPCSSILATGEVSADNNNKKAILYPNPTSDILNIKGIEVVSIRIVDASGKNTSMNVKDNSVEVRGLPRGVYIVQMVDKEGNIYIDKFIKK